MVGKIPWRKDRLPTPVFWPGEFHGVAKTEQLSQPDENKQRPLMLNLLLEGSKPASLAFLLRLKGRQRSGKAS